MEVRTTVSAFVVVPVISVAVTLYIHILIVCKYCSTFATGDGLYKIKTKGSGISYGAYMFPFVGCPNTLAGIFQKK